MEGSPCLVRPDFSWQGPKCQTADPFSRAGLAKSRWPPGGAVSKPPEIFLDAIFATAYQLRLVYANETELQGRTNYATRSEEHTSELQSLMRNSYAVFCLKKKKKS